MGVQWKQTDYIHEASHQSIITERCVTGGFPIIPQFIWVNFLFSTFNLTVVCLLDMKNWTSLLEIQPCSLFLYLMDRCWLESPEMTDSSLIKRFTFFCPSFSNLVQLHSEQATSVSELQSPFTLKFAALVQLHMDDTYTCVSCIYEYTQVHTHIFPYMHTDMHTGTLLQ